MLAAATPDGSVAGRAQEDGGHGVRLLLRAPDHGRLLELVVMMAGGRGGQEDLPLGEQGGGGGVPRVAAAAGRGG